MTPDGSIEGFERRRLPGDGVTIDALVGGSGPPLLLLHGFPQTRMIWRAAAPLLADRFTLVMPDLRGYDRFAVAGHDRGGRVAYRLALDHPQAVTGLAVLDILTTHDMWAGMTAESGIHGYHWYLLAQPPPLPETLIGGDPEFYVRYCIERWAAPGASFDEADVADYVACMRDPMAVHGACEDYRSGRARDRLDDAEDRAAGRSIECPTLVLWGELSAFARSDPLGLWRTWCTDVRGFSIPGGHFIPEEAPEEMAAAFLEFFGKDPTLVTA